MSQGNGPYLLIPNKELYIMKLADIQALFPKNPENGAVCGHIPMDWVENHLLEIKKVVKDNNLRRIYLGPRYKNRYNTLRKNATKMTLYPA